MENKLNYLIQYLDILEKHSYIMPENTRWKINMWKSMLESGKEAAIQQLLREVLPALTWLQWEMDESLRQTYFDIAEESKELEKEKETLAKRKRTSAKKAPAIRKTLKVTPGSLLQTMSETTQMLRSMQQEVSRLQQVVSTLLAGKGTLKMKRPALAPEEGPSAPPPLKSRRVSEEDFYYY